MNSRPGAADQHAPSSPLRILVLVSGSGTLLQAILDWVSSGDAPVQVVAVGSDRTGIAGLERAERAGVPTFTVALPEHPDRASWDKALANRIASFTPDLVVSAGLMKVLGPAVLAGVPVINTHPALLPSFPGAHGVRDALAAGVKVTGTTCHVVDAGVDTGPIIDQRVVAIEPDDSEDALHERIKVEERQMLIDVLSQIARQGVHSLPKRPA